MNCFQHIPESRGAIAKPPRGGATKKKADFTTQHALIGFKHPHLPQSSALHNRTYPCPLTSDRTRNARAPTSPRSIGFCAIWESISSSSSSNFLIDKFAGPRVIKETIKKDLPEGFQTSEFLLDHGFLDFIVERKDLKKKLDELLTYFHTMEK